MNRDDAQKQLELAQQITHIGSWQWDIATNRVMWSDELYRIYGLEPQSVELTFESFLARVHPEDRGARGARCRRRSSAAAGSRIRSASFGPTVRFASSRPR